MSERLSSNDEDMLEMIRRRAWPFGNEPSDLAPVLDTIHDAQLVLIGEATHGTDEFYRIRAELTKTLIMRHGFNVVAVEADWPDAYRANRWARHESGDPDAITALGDFTRFPRWMWRNTVTLEFLAWLREHNATRDARRHASFYGLDLYSLHSSVAAVLDYLQRVDPAAAHRARYRYACFEDYGEEPQAYGYAATFDLEKSCEDDVIAQLVDLRRRAPEYATRDGRVAADAYFFAEQNARVVRNAEQYYRAMFGGRTDSWNLRDTHMMQTLEALLGHVAATCGEARAVVWAHNSHLGDARATRMGSVGQINLGQLVRERYGDAARLVGFTTHAGEVTAASDWGEPAQRMRVQPSLPDSYERLFHDVGLPSFALGLRDDDTVGLRNPRLERAIGVIYRPDSERISHYFDARLSDQFDVVLHIDETHALRPLERRATDGVDMPETFPSAL